MPLLSGHWKDMSVDTTIYRYPVRLMEDDNETVLIEFPDFPEAHTFGDTKEEALERAVDALATVIDAYIAERRDIPAPSRIRGASVRLPALMAAKVALYESMREQKVGKAELARRLDVHLPQVDRLLDVRHGSRLDQLEAAFDVLGQRLEVSIIGRQGSGKISPVLNALRRRRKKNTVPARRRRRSSVEARAH